MSELDRVRALLAAEHLRAAMLELDRITYARRLDELGAEAAALASRAARAQEALVGGRAADSTEGAEGELLARMAELVDRVEAVTVGGVRDGSVGPAVEAERAPASAAPDIALKLTKACKRYRGGVVIGPVDVALGRGNVLAVVGPNGGGKTTILRMMAGFLALDGGAREVTSTDAAGRALRYPLAYVPETPPAWTGTMLSHLEWQAALHGATRPDANARLVRHVAHQLDIWADRDKRYAELSDGARMRVALADALLVEPAVVVLDEPLGPLDPISQDALLTWMRGFADDRGTSFVASTHHIAVVEAAADAVLLVRPGEPPLTFEPPPPAAASRTLRVVLERRAPRDGIRVRLASMRDAGAVVGFVESASGFVVVARGDTDAFAWAADAEAAIVSIEDCSRSALRAIMAARR